MLCKNCGKEIADTAKFCGYCGAQVEATPVTPAEVPAEQPQESVTNIFGVETPAVTEETTVMTPVKPAEPVSQQPDLSWISDTAPAQPKIQEPTPVAETPVVEAPKVELPAFDIATPEPAVASAPAEVPTEPVEPTVDVPTLETPTPVVETPVVVPLPEVKPLEEVKIDTLPVPPKEPEAVKESEVKVNNKKDFSTFLILFLTVVVVLLGVFIVWDKFLNVAPEEVYVEAGKLTEADVLKVAQEKYDALYGETFINLYASIVSGDVEEAGKYFTNDAISRIGANYTTGLFGTANQTKRTLSVVMFDENKVVIKGKNDTDKQYYYMTLIKVGEDWLIDMFE